MNPFRKQDSSFLYRNIHRKGDGTIDFEETLSGSMYSNDFKEARTHLRSRLRILYVFFGLIFLD